MNISYGMMCVNYPNYKNPIVCNNSIISIGLLYKDTDCKALMVHTIHTPYPPAFLPESELHIVYADIQTVNELSDPFSVLAFP